eukprot:scaffold19029_cov119-Isochrysis_galbana.AAC.3
MDHGGQACRGLPTRHRGSRATFMRCRVVLGRLRPRSRIYARVISEPRRRSESPARPSDLPRQLVLAQVIAANTRKVIGRERIDAWTHDNPGQHA